MGGGGGSHGDTFLLNGCGMLTPKPVHYKLQSECFFSFETFVQQSQEPRRPPPLERVNEVG